MWFRSSTDNTLLGHGCLKHKVTKELCIFGKFGEIWNKGTTLGLIVRSVGKNAQVARYLGLDRKSVSKGDEAQYTASFEQLPDLTLILRVPKQTGRQKRYANV